MSWTSEDPSRLHMIASSAAAKIVHFDGNKKKARASIELAKQLLHHSPARLPYAQKYSSYSQKVHLFVIEYRLSVVYTVITLNKLVILESKLMEQFNGLRKSQ